MVDKILSHVISYNRHVVFVNIMEDDVSLYRKFYTAECKLRRSLYFSVDQSLLDNISATINTPYAGYAGAFLTYSTRTQ